MRLESVCVYCGSAGGDDPDFAEGARSFGRVLAKSGIRLVYGGGSVGLMGLLAREALASEGEVLGVIPGFLRDREAALPDVSEMIVTDDMHQRKRAMFDHSDAFVVLPGGIGTLEETVEMMTWIQLGQHEKPIVLVNLNRFWDPLINLLQHMETAGFLHPPANGGTIYWVVNRVDDIIPAITKALESIPAGETDLTGSVDLL